MKKKVLFSLKSLLLSMLVFLMSFFSCLSTSNTYNSQLEEFCKIMPNYLSYRYPSAVGTESAIDIMADNNDLQFRTKQLEALSSSKIASTIKMATNYCSEGFDVHYSSQTINNLNLVSMNSLSGYCYSNKGTDDETWILDDPQIRMYFYFPTIETSGSFDDVAILPIETARKLLGIESTPSRNQLSELLDKVITIKNGDSTRKLIIKNFIKIKSKFDYGAALSFSYNDFILTHMFSKKYDANINFSVKTRIVPYASDFSTKEVVRLIKNLFFEKNITVNVKSFDKQLNSLADDYTASNFARAIISRNEYTNIMYIIPAFLLILTCFATYFAFSKGLIKVTNLFLSSAISLPVLFILESILYTNVWYSLIFVVFHVFIYTSLLSAIHKKIKTRKQVTYVTIQI